MSRTTRPGTLLVAALTTGLLLAACGDDDDTTDAAAADTTTTVADASEDERDEDEAADEEAPAGDVLEGEAVDYAFEGLPDSVPAGTKLSLTNLSEVEAHALVAFRIPDGETRSVEELLALPEEELMSMMSGPPATVLMVPPAGGEQIAAVGDGTLSEPGRYALVCFIPTGADPAALMEESGPDGPPQVDGGPPHMVHGMHAELVVQ